MIPASPAVPAPVSSSPWLKALLALLAFFVAVWPVGAVCRAYLPGHAWIAQAANKLGLLAVTLAGTRLVGLSREALGLRAPVEKAWLKGILGGLGLGAAATVGVLATGSVGLRPVLGNLGFGGMVLWVWIVSSAVEELFCRGFFFAWAGAGRAALWASAALFGAMHLGLAFMGVDLRALTVLVPLLFALGALAGWCRARSGSLYPAIAAHAGFNVGGLLGGVLFIIATGRSPGA